ncbi:DUF1146 family protein [Ligilactobacillus sp. Marseille-Q7487]|jgi:uncharacterized integral membrane protein (TIGR02327 family)|uniref:DUF1146 family protein n=1 Tax=Ligilactobacillus sp. Marseille-Q7487 TaxID=3022128 RepID=UPI0015B54F27|nr:DUF1146 family protein [Ligilactobacillus sp. Marseille-Q7487]
MKFYGFMAILTMISHLAFITIAFNGLQALRLDHYIAREKQAKFKIVLVMLSVAIGYGCSQFFLSFIDNIRNLAYLL